MSEQIPEGFQEMEFEMEDVEKITKNANSGKIEPFTNDDTDLFQKKIEAKMKANAEKKKISDDTPGIEVKGERIILLFNIK